jgi:UDP-N-acetylglucosamine:LPS N-acetylglucosamine transferase
LILGKAGQVMPRQERVVVISASVGAGHDGVAAEISDRLVARGFEVDLLDFLDMLPASLGRLLRGGYALELAVAPTTWGALYGVLDRRAGLAAAASRSAGLARGRVRQACGTRCAAVVSTYPLASQVLGKLRLEGWLGVPVASMVCDMSVHRLCVHPGVDVHLGMHKVAADQAVALAAPGVRVVSPVVSPRFRPAASRAEVVAIRRRFGLPVDARIAVVLAGSWGVGSVTETALDLFSTGLVLPVTVCGRNDRLLRRLRRDAVGIPLGWVDDMPSLLRSADVVVHNAGGLSSMEALATEVPLVTYRCLPGHGSANADALDLAGLSSYAHSVEELTVLLVSALRGELGEQQRSAAAAVWTAPDPAAVIAAQVRDRSDASR